MLMWGAEAQAPLAGVTVVEVGGIGPSPFAGMLLADLGADVIRIDRPTGGVPSEASSRLSPMNRGKRSVVLDLKQSDDLQRLLKIVGRSHILTEGFRPGVAERLGFGPSECLAVNQRLVYGRMTGYGQTGPDSNKAGHDINYIGLTGALHAIGPRNGAPCVPLNLLGDFGGGGLYFALGLVGALRSAERDGEGQVVDAAIIDGTCHLLSWVHGMLNEGLWMDSRESNIVDGGAPFYRVYETADKKFMAVGAIEGKFYERLISTLGVDLAPETQYDRTRWPDATSKLAQAFKSRSRREWAEVFRVVDACVTPVLTLAEAPEHPHIASRGSLLRTPTGIQAGLTPRFASDDTRLRSARESPLLGEHTQDVLISLEDEQ